MAVPHMTWGASADSLREHLTEAINHLPPAQRVEAAHTAFINWCRDYDLDPRKTRLDFADYIRSYPHKSPVINLVTDHIPTKYNVRGVWTP